MNEYEQALFSAVMVLTKAAAAQAADRTVLAAAFREFASMMKDQGREGGAAVLEMLAGEAEENVSYSVIPGGKSDPSN